MQYSSTAFLRQIGVPTADPVRLTSAESALTPALWTFGDIVLIALDPDGTRSLAALTYPGGPVEFDDDIDNLFAAVAGARTPAELSGAFSRLSEALVADGQVIPLYVTSIEEWFHVRVEPPFETVLDGFQAYGGMPELARPTN